MTLVNRKLSGHIFYLNKILNNLYAYLYCKTVYEILRKEGDQEA